MLFKPIYKKELKLEVDWNMLSTNPNAVPVLEQFIENINWSSLTINPYATHLLEKNRDKIDNF